MKAAECSWLVVSMVVCVAVPAGEQPRAGAVAVDEWQGDLVRLGRWTARRRPAARPAALGEFTARGVRWC